MTKKSKIAHNSNDVEQRVERHWLFCVYDEKAAVYSPNFIVHPTINVAIRSFTAACQNPQSFLAQFPSDYALYHVGYFDEVTAKVFSFPEPRFVIRASEALNLNKSIKEVSDAPSQS